MWMAKTETGRCPRAGRCSGRSAAQGFVAVDIYRDLHRVLAAAEDGAAVRGLWGWIDDRLILGARPLVARAGQNRCLSSLSTDINESENR